VLLTFPEIMRTGSGAIYTRQPQRRQQHQQQQRHKFNVRNYLFSRERTGKKGSQIQSRAALFFLFILFISFTSTLLGHRLIIIDEENDNRENKDGTKNGLVIDESFTPSKHDQVKRSDSIHNSINSSNSNSDSNSGSSNVHEWINHEIPKDGFSGCLLLKDDNDRLAEWMAYHWLVLPLKYLVVGIDPTGTSSPKHILDTWNDNHMGIEIELWNDVDYGHWVNEELDEKHKHRARQKRFLAECERHHKEKGRTWLAIIDPDEYITFNTINDDDPKVDLLEEVPEKFLEEEYIHEMQSIRKGFEKTNMFHQTIFSFINENRDKEPWKSEQCYLMPRLFFSSLESSSDVISKANIQQHGIDPLQFSTLRYFHHARRGSFDYNHYGKVLVDLTRIQMKEINLDMYSVHRPNYISCLPPMKPYFDGILRVHHYLGSWEQYSTRVDVRRSRKRFDEFGSVDYGTDFQLQYWLEMFVDRVGSEKAKLLLSSAGVVDQGPVRIMDTHEYIHVQPRIDNKEGEEQVLTYFYDEDGNIVDVKDSNGKSLPTDQWNTNFQDT
jgi:hypothetical protein